MKIFAAAKRLRWRMLKPVLEKTGAIAVVFADGSGAPRAHRAARSMTPFPCALEGSNYISAWTLEILPGRADLTQALAVLRRQ